jgi:hypothetical protein
MTLPTSHPAGRAPRALGLCCLIVLGGCGGADPADPVDARREAAAAAPALVAPLLNDDGSPAPSDPRAVPGDAAAWSRLGLYATAAQAGQLAAALGDGVLELRVDCCSADAVESATGIAWGLQAAHSWPNDMPVLVRGQDLRLAAATANRLADGGLTHVWLVTP